MNTINKITEKQVVMKQDQIGSKFNLKGGLKMKVCEKYAWVILLAVGLLWLVVGIVAVFQPEGILGTDVKSVTNMPWSELKASSPLAANFVIFAYGQSGLHGMHAAFFVIAITLTGYRKGEKWAWYTMVSVPVYLVSGALFAAIFIGDVSQMLQFIPITTITLLGLLLPYRKFFPK